MPVRQWPRMKIGGTSIVEAAIRSEKTKFWMLPSVEFTTDIADICSTKGSREGEMA